jgi:hypothetical protein
MMPLRVDLATVMDGQEELMESEPETNEPPAGREKGIKNRDFKRAPPERAHQDRESEKILKRE